MKNFLICLMLFFVIALQASELYDRIDKYSGVNAEELKTLLEKQAGDTLSYLQFLLENCSPTDLAVLKAEFLIENIRLAEQTREFQYTNYPDDIYRHFVLPYRVSQEPLQEWRKEFYPELKDLVKDEENIEAAAILVNLWALEQMTYKPTHGRDQAPLTTIKRGYGRCEEMMIIYIAAARSVGIPARPASVPYWNFTDSNHAWVEIWTPDGWKYLGEPENTLNKAWFTKTTKRASLITAEAFGNYDSRNTIKQVDNVTYISSIEYYTDYKKCQIYVVDAEKKPVAEAKVTLYATSFGGLFPMIDLKTDSSGKVDIPLGEGTLWVTAAKDELFGQAVFPIMEQANITITLQADKELQQNFTFLFPLAEEKVTEQNYRDVLGDKFDLMRENSKLKRDNRLKDQRFSNKFVKYYDLAYSSQKRDDDYYSEREDFLQKSDEIAGNAENFLHVFEKLQDPMKNRLLIHIIEEWDIKELCEIPDSTAIENALQIYFEGKKRYEKTMPDSLFKQNVIGFTWQSATPPQNGWQKGFYNKIEKLADPDPLRTVENVKNWLHEVTVLDEDFAWTYFSGSLNPLEIVKMKYVPGYYQRKVLNCAIKLLGIPVRWKGRLEFYNGNEFVAVKEVKEEKEKDKAAEVVVTLFIDGIQHKAEPFENFLLAKLDEDRRITYTYFDGKNDSLAFRAEYRRKPNDHVYVEAFTRNSNGDANISIVSIAEDQNEIEIRLNTPKEYIDVTDKWEKKTLDNIYKLLDEFKKNKHRILFIRGEVSSEPQVSMLKSLVENSEKFLERDTDLILYSQNRNNQDVSYDSLTKLSGKKLISEELTTEDYPVIFLIDKNKQVVFSSSGFNLGISKLLQKKVRKLNSN